MNGAFTGREKMGTHSHFNLCRSPSDPGLKLVRHFFLLTKSYNMGNGKTPHRLKKIELVLCDMIDYTEWWKTLQDNISDNKIVPLQWALEIWPYGFIFSLIPVIVLPWEKPLWFSGLIWGIWEYTGKWHQVNLGDCLSNPLPYCKIQFICVTCPEMAFEHRVFEALFSVTDSSC